MTRHKLLPTRGTGISWYIDGYEQALESAHRAFRETGIPIAIVRSPRDGIREVLETVGGENRRRRAGA